MDDVISLILSVFKFSYDTLSGFQMTALGFTFSMWDILVAFVLLDLIVPIVLLTRRSNSMGQRSTERIKKKSGSGGVS